MGLSLTILYRGPLSSCNYDCWYCPFAKRHETAAELAADRRALARFVDWAAGRTGDSLAVFFTPWGEALVRRSYQEGIARLTRRPHVRKVAVQTNLSCPLDWLDECATDRLGLWCTYHPSQIERGRFLEQCRQLEARGIRYNVGMVGVKEDFEEIEALRRELPAHVYLWINAHDGRPDDYSESETRRLERVDLLFRTNVTGHQSFGRSCRTGRSVISVDGEGTIRRCHFVRQAIGNIYDPAFEAVLVERPCPNRVCDCHIGYVHLDELKLYDVYGDGVLERIPRRSAAIRSGVVANVEGDALRLGKVPEGAAEFAADAVGPQIEPLE